MTTDNAVPDAHQSATTGVPNTSQDFAHLPDRPDSSEGPGHTGAEIAALAEKLVVLATTLATKEADLMDLIAKFDEANGAAHFEGIGSTAHWLSWQCGYSGGTAREHVRVAKALRRMPRTRELFGQGALSYAKVRELTRLVDQVKEAELADFARYTTASQLARTIRAHRLPPGSRLPQELKRELHWQSTPDDMERLVVTMPREEAALLKTAMETAMQQLLRDHAADAPEPADDTVTDASADLCAEAEGGSPPEDSGHQQPAEGASEAAGTARPRVTDDDRVQALLDIATIYLDGASRRPADDHTVVTVHVAAEQLDPAYATAAGQESASSVSKTTPVTLTAETDATATDATSAMRATVDATSAMPASVDSATTDAFVTPAKDAPTHDTPVGDASAASTDADASPIDHRVSTPSDSDAVTPGVPAGTPSASPTLVEELRRNVCHIPGTGPITAATAQRLACTATLQAVLHDSRGNALALGRSRRLASPGQRRALAARDHHTCQFPGCQQHYRLDAHHITPWALGGKTDLDNLVLLCRRHHTLIHEAGITITASAAPVPGHRFRFRRANGAPIEPIAPSASREYAWAQELSAVIPPADANVGSIGPIDVRTVGQGEGFNLHECVRVLFELTITDPTDGDESDPSSSAGSNDSSPTQDTLPAA